MIKIKYTPALMAFAVESAVKQIPLPLMFVLRIFTELNVEVL